MSVGHSYEEVREAVVDALLGDGPPDQFESLKNKVAVVLGQRTGRGGAPGGEIVFGSPRLHPFDAELVRDVFWDLFRQGAITLGMNDNNPAWPFFRLSHLGKRTLASQNPYRFHDAGSYLALVRREDPDISDAAIGYLEEAVAAYYAQCLLASSVMLGVAAETEFLRLCDTAAASPRHGAAFTALTKDGFVRGKIRTFQAALRPLASQLTPKKDFEELDTNLNFIQALLRIARNEAGHPSGKEPPSREQVFVNLQLFVPLAGQLARLRAALS